MKTAVDKSRKHKGVYVIGPCNSHYKIGFTNNVVKRFKLICWGNPEKMEVLYFFGVEENAKLEAELHKRFEKLRASGEWFKLSESEFFYLEELKKIFPCIKDKVFNLPRKKSGRPRLDPSGVQAPCCVKLTPEEQTFLRGYGGSVNAGVRKLVTEKMEAQAETVVKS